LPKVTAYAQPVTPAKAGVQNMLKRLDSGFRRHDGARLLEPNKTFGNGYEIPFSSVLGSFVDMQRIAKVVSWGPEQRQPNQKSIIIFKYCDSNGADFSDRVTHPS